MPASFAVRLRILLFCQGLFGPPEAYKVNVAGLSSGPRVTCITSHLDTGTVAYVELPIHDTIAGRYALQQR